MEEKLKLILKRIHWSLVLKAAIFAVAWFALPLWLFLPVAFILYFKPIPGSAKVVLPFLVLLFLTLFEGPSVYFAIIFGILFYFVLVIKDLLIIDRRSAYEVLVLILSYLLFRGFFIKSGGDFGGWSLLFSCFIAAVFGFMVSGFISNFSDAFRDEKPFRRMVSWIMFILMWQLLLVGLFLPLDFIYQSAIVFLVAMVFIDMIPAYIFGELSRTKTIITSSVIFTLLAIIASSARWGL